jgi:CHAD domain-containing protein
MRKKNSAVQPRQQKTGGASLAADKNAAAQKGIAGEKSLVHRIRAFQWGNQANRRCADCTEPGPTYICLVFSTFICQTCSGIHRGFGHKIKGIAFSDWSDKEVCAIEAGGNARAADVWLANWNPALYEMPSSGQTDLVKEWIRLKYVERRWWRALPEVLSEPAKVPKEVSASDQTVACSKQDPAAALETRRRRSSSNESITSSTPRRWQRRGRAASPLVPANPPPPSSGNGEAETCAAALAAIEAEVATEMPETEEKMVEALEAVQDDLLSLRCAAMEVEVAREALPQTEEKMVEASEAVQDDLLSLSCAAIEVEVATEALPQTEEIVEASEAVQDDLLSLSCMSSTEAVAESPETAGPDAVDEATCAVIEVPEGNDDGTVSEVSAWEWQQAGTDTDATSGVASMGRSEAPYESVHENEAMPVLSPATAMPASLLLDAPTPFAFAPAMPPLAAPEILPLGPGRMATPREGAAAASAFDLSQRAIPSEGSAAASTCDLEAWDPYLPAKASVDLLDGLDFSGFGPSSSNTQATVVIASPSPPKEEEGLDAWWPADFSGTAGSSASVTSCLPFEQWSTPVLESQTSTMGDRMREAVLNSNSGNLKQLLSECWAQAPVAVPPQRTSSVDWFETGVALGGAPKTPPQNCCGVTSGLTSAATLPAASDEVTSPVVHDLAVQDSPRAPPDFADLLCVFHAQHPISGLETVFNVGSHHRAATVDSA